MNKSDIKILIVDDEEKILSRIERILSKEGYMPDVSPNGITAIKYLSEKEYDIILTDINLPDKSGFEIMDFIKSSGLDILMLVLTGYASVDSAIRAIKMGAYDFIQKPADAETLKLVIHRAAERVMLKKENEKNLKELEKLNELKDEFISVVSHDLRSPLSSIGGYASYLLKKGELTHTQRSYLMIIKEIADDLYILVNELLDISKIEMGAIQVNRDATDVSELITTSINNFLLLASDKNTRIDFINEIKNQIIYVDRMKILQVLNNLVNNAVKFTENGRILVTARDTGDYSAVVITLKDSGTGIPPEALENIFDKYSFFRKEGTRGERGTGLGLVICKRFVELHNGTIRAYSRISEGSTFEIILPRGIQG